jgi:hypothetical protein
MTPRDPDDACSCSCPQSCLCCGPKSTFRDASWFLYTSTPSCKSILHSSSTPTPLERQGIFERASAARTELQRLSRRKAYITKLLAEVETEIAEIKSVVGTYESLMAPIRLLPFDIIHQIFTVYHEGCNGTGGRESIQQLAAALPSSAADDRTPSQFRLMNGPWELGSICSRWRDMILSIPTLWSTITLVLSRPQKFPHKMLMLLWEGLSRSKECPLIINIITCVELEALCEPLLLLSAHSARFKELAMYFGKGTSSAASLMRMTHMFSFLEPRCKGQLPALEKLALFVDLASPTQVNNLTYRPVSTLFSNAPKLRVIELGIERLADVLDLPWRQLKTIRLHSASRSASAPSVHINLYDFLNVLRRCANLEECSVGEVELIPRQSLDFDSEAAAETIYWNTTQKLSTQRPGVLKHLTLPNLTLAHCIGLRVHRDGGTPKRRGYGCIKRFL